MHGHCLACAAVSAAMKLRQQFWFASHVALLCGSQVAEETQTLFFLFLVCVLW